MIKFKTTLFTRLYLSISTAILISTFLTFSIVESYLSKEDVSHFAEDTGYLYDYLVDSTVLSTLVTNQSIKLPLFFRERFFALIVETPYKEFNCNNCIVLRRSPDRTYYEEENGVRFAVIKLSIENKSLIIKENLEKILEEESEINIEEIAFPLLIFLCFVTIASLLYWPVRKLQSDIKKLIGYFADFARGNHKIRANEDIPKPLDEIALSFNEMADSIDKSIEERSVFAQAIPHEIRTPLSRIQLASGLIQKSSKHVDVINWANDIDNYIEDINMFISQIMELTKLNNGMENSLNSSYRTIELNRFVSSRVAQLNSEQLREVIIDIDKSISIHNDPIHLTLLFDNLFKNALSYSTNKVAITAKNENGHLIISVEDDGKGIAIEDREKVFIPFNRLDKSRNRKTGGFGLGLAIANASANRIGGRLCVTQSRWGGAKFSFSLDN